MAELNHKVIDFGRLRRIADSMRIVVDEKTTYLVDLEQLYGAGNFGQELGTPFHQLTDPSKHFISEFSFKGLLTWPMSTLLTS